MRESHRATSAQPASLDRTSDCLGLRFAVGTQEVLEVRSQPQSLASWCSLSPPRLLRQSLSDIFDRTSLARLGNALDRLKYASPISVSDLRLRKDPVKAPGADGYLRMSRQEGVWLEVATPLAWRVLRFEYRLLHGYLNERWDDDSLLHWFATVLGAEAIALVSDPEFIHTGALSNRLVREQIIALQGDLWESPHVFQDLSADYHILLAPTSETGADYLLGYSRTPWSRQALTLVEDARVALAGITALRNGFLQ